MRHNPFCTPRTACRWTTWLLVLLLCVLPIITAFATETQDPVFVDPELSEDAKPYDPAHPEDLQADQLYARSAIVIEADTGEVVFEKNADEVMYPASTTKVLTTLLGLQHGDMEQTVYLSQTANDVAADSSTIGLDVGESINMLDLLYATMVVSGNEGANLIAESVSGDINSFVDLMNQTVQSYGCQHTHFANAHGYHDDNHYSTARDLAVIAQHAMQNETFRDIAGTFNFALPRSNVSGSRVLISSSDVFFNPNLEDNSYYYPYATGIKTGYHSRAGHCYIGSAEKDGVKLISVVLYTSKAGRWVDTAKLLEYGFSQFQNLTPQELYALNPIQLETSFFSMEDDNVGRLVLDAKPQADTRTVNIVATHAEVERMSNNLLDTVLIQYERNFATPITKGELFGYMTYYPIDGSEPVTYDLVASRSIARREDAPKSIAEIKMEVQEDPNPFPKLTLRNLFLMLWPLLLIIVIVRFIARLFRPKKKNKKSRVPEPKHRFFQ